MNAEFHQGYCFLSSTFPFQLLNFHNYLAHRGIFFQTNLFLILPLLFVPPVLPISLFLLPMLHHRIFCLSYTLFLTHCIWTTNLITDCPKWFAVKFTVCLAKMLLIHCCFAMFLCSFMMFHFIFGSLIFMFLCIRKNPFRSNYLSRSIQNFLYFLKKSYFADVYFEKWLESN